MSKFKMGFNRKFNIKKDFNLLMDLEHKVLPIIRDIKDTEKQAYLEKYVREIFFNQFKK